MGETALRGNTQGNFNVAVGINALLFNETGSRNTAIGRGALFNLTTGSHNIALGDSAGEFLEDVDSPTGASTHTNNIFIGNVGGAQDSNSIRIGTQGAHFNTYIAGVYATSVVGTHYVVVDANGQVGQGPPLQPSSRRYKEDIEGMGASSSRLLDLRPVTFRFREEFKRGDPSLQYGLIAEEVAEVLPELVSFDDEGRPAAVKYRFLSSILLNELQKQHRRIQVQGWLLGLMLLVGIGATIGRWQFG